MAPMLVGKGKQDVDWVPEGQWGDGHVLIDPAGAGLRVFISVVE